MKGKRVIAAILLVGILAATLAGCKNEDISKKETEKPVITLGSDNYPPYIHTCAPPPLAANAFNWSSVRLRGWLQRARAEE